MKKGRRKGISSRPCSSIAWRAQQRVDWSSCIIKTQRNADAMSDKLVCLHTTRNKRPLLWARLMFVGLGTNQKLCKLCTPCICALPEQTSFYYIHLWSRSGWLSCKVLLWQVWCPGIHVKHWKKKKPQLTNLHLRGLKEMIQQPWQPSSGGHDALPFLGRLDS